MNNHNHCWHDCGVTKKVHGVMRQVEACCWCGLPREMSLRVILVRHGGHGPYVPVKEATGTVPAALAVNGG